MAAIRRVIRRTVFFNCYCFAHQTLPCFWYKRAWELPHRGCEQWKSISTWSPSAQTIWVSEVARTRGQRGELLGDWMRSPFDSRSYGAVCDGNWLCPDTTVGNEGRSSLERMAKLGYKGKKLLVKMGLNFTHGRRHAALVVGHTYCKPLPAISNPATPSAVCKLGLTLSHPMTPHRCSLAHKKFILEF